MGNQNEIEHCNQLSRPNVKDDDSVFGAESQWAKNKQRHLEMFGKNSRQRASSSLNRLQQEIASDMSVKPQIDSLKLLPARQSSTSVGYDDLGHNISSNYVLKQSDKRMADLNTHGKTYVFGSLGDSQQNQKRSPGQYVSNQHLLRLPMLKKNPMQRYFSSQNVISKSRPNSIDRVCLSVRAYKEADSQNDSRQVQIDHGEDVHISDASISDQHPPGSDNTEEESVISSDSVSSISEDNSQFSDPMGKVDSLSSESESRRSESCGSEQILQDQSKQKRSQQKAPHKKGSANFPRHLEAPRQNSDALLRELQSNKAEKEKRIQVRSPRSGSQRKMIVSLRQDESGKQRIQRLNDYSQQLKHRRKPISIYLQFVILNAHTYGVGD